MLEPTGGRSDIREERRSITILFADLVGSTTLAERLDQAELRIVVGDAIARIVGEVERLGGFVKDLAGDGVLAFFGAPVASEDDAERALLAGLAIVESIEGYATEVERGWGVADLGVRVGVATGQVAVGVLGAGTRLEYAAYGDSVNTAARLQSVTEAGTVLADMETRRLAEPMFDWSEPMARKLRGKEAHVVASMPLRARPTAGKARGLPGVETPLIGRDREARQLAGALERVRAGSGGVTVVLGEAGIGKTRLVNEARARYEGMWLEGRCVSYGESLPYWPFRDLVREWVGAAPDDSELRVRVRLRRAIDELFASRALEIYPYLCSLLGITPEADASARLADLAPEALQYRTFEVVEELLGTLASSQPLVVQLEDLHWADPTSITLVERILAIGEHAAVLLLITQRDDRDHASWRIRERAARDVPHLLSEIALEPLSGDAEREMLRAIVGPGTLPRQLEDRILDAAEGNPFFLEELIRSLSDVGAIVRDDSGWRLDHDVAIEVPPTVERVILARIDRLSSACHEVLTAASSLGRHFGRPLLEAVLERPDGLDGALHDLQRVDLVRATRRWPQPEYRFKHALIGDAAYHTLLPERRRTLHRRAAEWLERQHSGAVVEVLGLLAHHWLEAGDGDKATAYLARAGDQARAEWSLDEAVGHYRKLLPLLDERGRTQEMALTLFKLALALHQALRFGEANEAYQRAFELWTPPTPPAAVDATLRVAMLALPDDADPYRSHRIVNIQHFMALFDRLVEAWPDRTIVPSLAERWDIAEDGLRYVLHLRPDLRWSDGVPLTAHDVEYGVKRALDRVQPGPSVAIFFVLDHAQDYFQGRHDDLSRIGVRALDDQTVEFRLAVPAPYFMYVLNRPDCAPQPRHVIEALGGSWVDPDRQVLSGAFRRVEHGPGRIVLERRDDGLTARGGNVRRVEMRALPLDEAVEAFGRGELDVVNTQFQYATSLGAVAEPEVHLDPPAWLVYLALRHQHPLLQRTEFRRALAFATDRDRLRELALPNAAVATGGVVPPPLQGHTPDITPPFDPDRAREELRRSGVTEGVELMVLGWDAEATAVAAMAAGWEDVLGLRFPVRAVSIDEYEGVSASAPIQQAGWFPGYPDPEYFLRLLLHSDALDNYGGYASERFDALIERARAEPDGRSRLELFHAADRLAVADEIAVIPLLYVRNVILTKPWVHGWWEYGKSWSSFADLTLDPVG